MLNINIEISLMWLPFLYLKNSINGTSMNLFVYGTLMYPEIWKKVVSGTYEQQTAYLQGFQRWKVIGEYYPVIIPDLRAESIQGILYYALDEQDWKVLDRFEGNLYFREKVQVKTMEGNNLDAFVYVLKESWYQVIEYKPWSDYWFNRYGRHLFLKEWEGE